MIARTENRTVAPNPTWDQLVDLEPALGRLLYRIEQTPPGSNAIDQWYGHRNGWGFKRELEHLVGWGRRNEHPVLSTSRSYNVAYQRLFDALERQCERRRAAS